MMDKKEQEQHVIEDLRTRFERSISKEKFERITGKTFTVNADEFCENMDEYLDRLEEDDELVIIVEEEDGRGGALLPAGLYGEVLDNERTYSLDEVVKELGTIPDDDR